MTVLLARSRYTYLDLVRGLAAIAVILVHYRWFYATAPGDWRTSFAYKLPFAAVLQPFYDHGGFAVQLFWLLSGAVFVIRYGTARFDGRRFWVWRFARLYPLHFATLLLITAIQLVSVHLTGRPTVYDHFDLYHFGLQLVMAGAWGFEHGDSFNAPVWSVSVEILIYFAFFLYMRIMRATLIRQLLISTAFTMIWILVRARWAQCGSLFFLGGALPIALAVGGRIAPRLIRRMAFAAFPVACLGIWVVTVALDRYIPQIVYYYTLLPALMITTLACDAALPPTPRGTHWIGTSTYTTYLMHMPILISAKIWLDARPDRLAILASPMTLIIYVATVIGVAMAVHYLFEQPMRRAIQQRWNASPAHSAPAAEEKQRTI